MGEWIKENPVLSSLINFALLMIIILFFTKIYIDYRIDVKVEKIERQLDRIEGASDTMMEILKTHENE